MPRSRWVRPAFTVLALGALAVATVLAVTPAGPRLLGSTAAVPISSVTSQYSCDLSGYGYAGPPVTMTANANVPPATPVIAAPGFGAVFAAAGTGTFSTSAAMLPVSVAAQLANLSSISLASTVSVFGAPAASPVATIAGSVPDEFLPSGPLTELRVANATVTGFFSTAGTAWLEFPAQPLVITPYRNGKALPVITCAAVPGPVPPLPVTVASVPVVAQGQTPASIAPVPVPAGSAPVYGCTSTYRTTATYRSPLPMAITTSGPLTVGSPLTVTLSSPVTGLGAPVPGQAAKLAFTGLLPVTGAQPGQVRLRETTVDADDPTFTVSGLLRLTRPGPDAISFPHQFVYTVYLRGGPKAVFACTLIASSGPTALSVTVAP